MNTKSSSDGNGNISSALILRTDFIALQKAITAHLEMAVKQHEEAPDYGENDDYKQSQERLVTANHHHDFDESIENKA